PSLSSAAFPLVMVCLSVDATWLVVVSNRGSVIIELYLAARSWNSRRPAALAEVSALDRVRAVIRQVTETSRRNFPYIGVASYRWRYVIQDEISVSAMLPTPFRIHWN